MTEESMQKLQAMLSRDQPLDADLLIKLAPELPDLMLSRTIEITRLISDKSKRTLAAEVLAARSLKIEVADDRTRALIDLSSLVSEAKRTVLLSQAFEAAKDIGDPWTRAVAMHDIFLLWPDVNVLNNAMESLEAARKIINGPESERKLRDISSDLSEQAYRLLSQSATEESSRGKTKPSATVTTSNLKGDERESLHPKKSEMFSQRGSLDWDSLALRWDGPSEQHKAVAYRKPPSRQAGVQSIDIKDIKVQAPSTSFPSDVPTITDKSKTRIVNTGFAPESQASNRLDPTMPLEVNCSYYFWLDVGKRSRKTIETKPTALPEDLPVGARLVVAIFPFKDEIRIKPGSDVGELMLNSNGTAQVMGKKPAVPANISADLLNRRLYFPVRTPDRSGTFRLRCSIYYNQVLVQSRLIKACVMDEPESIAGALQSDVDYTLTDTLRPAHFTALAPHRLSLMVNSNGDGTHTFSFLGADGKEPFKNECNISAPLLKTLTENARTALREVSWGSPGPYEDGLQYKYQQYTLDQLEKDLIKLAIRGWNLYDSLIFELTGGNDEFINLMRQPGGLVQIALKQSPTLILPAALFYDQPIDPNNQDMPLRLCDAFINSLDGMIPLEKTPCFQGKCPRYEELDYVCPSGFWGYRHILGLPVSLKEGEVPTEILFNEGLEIVVGGEYKSLQKTRQHVANIHAIRKDIDLHDPPTRNKILEELKKTKAQLIYFYCHGGYREDIKLPYLQVDEGNILGSDLRAHNISWKKPPHPLVFINGCHTAALDPEQAYNLVESFVEKGCAGVIGTEITIFEQLACDFAEECLRQFLAGNASIGEAIRGARLELLRRGNPLGLVYTPFVTADLHLRQMSASSKGASPGPST
jgi:hypothetical protein